MEIPKILVASPTYHGMQYCEKEFIESLTNLDYPNYDIFIVDNSKTEDYFKHFKKEFPEINILKDNTSEEKSLLRLISSRNLIIDFALQNNYNYILMMDSDVIPPKNIIQELLKSNKDIVSGLYYNYFISDGRTKYLPVAWTELTEKEFNEIKQKIKLPNFVKSSEDLRVRLTEEDAQSNNLIPVVIPSAGCMLIKRLVFEKIRYNLLDTQKMNNIKTTDDIGFILNARKQGFKSYCNTKIKCEHLIKEKFRKDKQGVYHHPMYE